MGLANTILLDSPEAERIVTYLETVALASNAGIAQISPRGIQQIVKAGKAQDYFRIGDQIVTNWNNGTTNYDMPFNVVSFDNAVDANGDTVPAMWLESHYALPELMFDGSEAIWRVGSTPLAAGSYYWTFGANWGTYVVKDATYTFTLTEAVPAGGCIVAHRSDNLYLWAAPDQAASNWRISTYSSLSSVTPIETVTPSHGNTGTSLGTLTNTTVYSDATDTLNNVQRAVYGYNRWSQSAMRQWLNSADAAGAWWTPQNTYDRPPQQLATMRGFMAGLSDEFLGIIRPVKVTTALNTVTDGGTSTAGTEDTYDRFFVASLQQRYIVPQLENVEGSAWQYWIDRLGLSSPMLTGSANIYPNSIKYSITNHSTAMAVRLRSAIRGSAYGAWSVFASGYAGALSAADASAPAPACVIC